MATHTVMTGDTAHEEIDITIDGSRMVIDGPNWFGEGLLVGNRYVGRAYYKRHVNDVAAPLQPVFHVMYRAADDRYVGAAVFPTGCVDLLWKLIPSEPGAASQPCPYRYLSKDNPDGPSLTCEVAAPLQPVLHVMERDANDHYVGEPVNRQDWVDRIKSFVNQHGRDPSEAHVTPAMESHMCRWSDTPGDRFAPLCRPDTLFGMHLVWDAAEFKLS